MISPPRVMEIKAKINKWNLIKLKSIFIPKEISTKSQRQPIEWEKYLQMLTDKSLISKTYKQHIQLNIKKKLKTWLEIGRRPE